MFPMTMLAGRRITSSRLTYIVRLSEKRTKLNMRKCLASVLCGVGYIGPVVLKPQRACWNTHC